MTLAHKTWRLALIGGLLLVGLAVISPALGADVGVSIAGKKFDPGTIVVAQGTTVTWTITQAIGEPHTVTSKKTDTLQQGAVFDSQTTDPDLSQLKDQNATFKFTFKDAGVFDYTCLVHPEMTGQVVVLAPGQSPPPGEPAAGEGGAVSANSKLIGAGILVATLVILFGAAYVWRRMNPA